MKVLTADEMRAVDKTAIEDYGIPGPVLMERAGVAVASKVMELHKAKRALIFAGGGNNGGDGLVVARELRNTGIDVRIVMAGKRGRMSDDCALQLNIVKKMKIPVEYRQKIESRDLHGSVFVDALFGTGLSKNVTGPLADTIGFVNGTGCPVVSVDIPSGINADTGAVMGAAFRAGATVTFGAPKRGLVLHPGAGYAGKLFVEDIGFPRELFDKVRSRMVTSEDAASLMPVREEYSHKGDYGHVFVLAGSRGKTGAALLSARGALRYGTGLVTIGVPEPLMEVFQSRVSEEMTLPLPATGDGNAHSVDALDDILRFIEAHADVLAIGPGLGRDGHTVALVRELIVLSTIPMVIDADALNALEGSTGLLGKLKSPAVLTPHPGEFARMAGVSRDEVEADRVGAAERFAASTGTYVILKGVPTVIAEPEGHTFINTTGNAGMATAGAGDVLTGIVASFMAQGLGPLEASVLGTYLHGMAGDLTACGGSEHSVVATDLAEAAPMVFRAMKEAVC